MRHAFHRPAGRAFVACVGRLAVLAAVLAVLPLRANAADGQSGIMSQGCGPVDTSTLGYKTVTCTATNGAGLVGTRKLTYKVIAP